MIAGYPGQLGSVSDWLALGSQILKPSFFLSLDWLLFSSPFGGFFPTGQRYARLHRNKLWHWQCYHHLDLAESQGNGLVMEACALKTAAIRKQTNKQPSQKNPEAYSSFIQKHSMPFRITKAASAQARLIKLPLQAFPIRHASAGWARVEDHIFHTAAATETVPLEPVWS